MTPEILSERLFEIVLAYAETNNLNPQISDASDVFFERPKNRDHGDWATSLPLKLAKAWNLNPREIAEIFSEKLSVFDDISMSEVAGPGFINIRLEAAAAGKVVEIIIEQGHKYGLSHSMQGIKTNLEFVSANPTGPIHLGGTRWAAVGDSLARILSAVGSEVTKEYYFNDHGAQIDRFARSLVASYQGKPTPEDGYGGAYIEDIAKRVASSYGDGLDSLAQDDLIETFRSIGVELMFGEIKKSLSDFGVTFDVFFHEDSLHSTRAVDRAVQKLFQQGHVYELDGAVWLRTTSFGDDKDRVIIKSDGLPAYIAADLAYYLDKRERGFDRNIIMLGADHHGYVARMMAMCAAFGDVPGENLEIMIGQMVNLVRNGQPMRMSKRAGTIVTLEDLVEAVGVDASRYALVRSSTDSQIDIDLDVLSKQTNDNPVFYVQYAHARTCAVARNAHAHGISRSQGFSAELLNTEADSQLLGALQEFPRIIELSAQLREPHRVARFLEELAGIYHRWYDKTRVLPQSDEDPTLLHFSRLGLNDAAGQVFRNGLGLLGVSAPEKM